MREDVAFVAYVCSRHIAVVRVGLRFCLLSVKRLHSSLIQRLNGKPIFRLTRVTRIFEKSVFTETTPRARAGCRAGFFVARTRVRSRGRVSRVCKKTGKYRRSKPCRFKKAKAEIQPDGRAGRSIGQPSSRRLYYRNAPRASRAR